MRQNLMYTLARSAVLAALLALCACDVEIDGKPGVGPGSTPTTPTTPTPPPSPPATPSSPPTTPSSASLPCTGGTTSCGTSCVNLQTDSLNCGQCGHGCPITLVCNAGVCGCPAGLTSCFGSCVDTTSSSYHCGACGKVCGGGEACIGSSCQATCSSGAVKSCTTGCGNPGQRSCGSAGTWGPCKPQGKVITLCDSTSSWYTYSGGGGSATLYSVAGCEGQAVGCIWNMSSTAGYWGIVYKAFALGLTGYTALALSYKTDCPSCPVQACVTDADYEVWCAMLPQVPASTWTKVKVKLADLVFVERTNPSTTTPGNFQLDAQVVDVRLRHYPYVVDPTIAVDEILLVDAGTTPVVQGRFDAFDGLAPWTTNASTGAGVTTSLVTGYGASGSAMRLDYTVGNASTWWYAARPVGFGWTGYGALRFVARAPGDAATVMVAVKDADGEIYQAQVKVTSAGWTSVVVPLSSLQRDPYDLLGNGSLDLSTVAEVRFKHAPGLVGTGAVEVDELSVW